RIMDDVRKLVSEMKDEENQLLKQRYDVAEASAAFARYSIGIGTLLAFLLGSAISFIIVRSITIPTRAAVSQLSTTCAELLASTAQQAAGAQEQAAAVSQTVTTVDEVTQTAEQTSRRAKSVGEA